MIAAPDPNAVDQTAKNEAKRSALRWAPPALVLLGIFSGFPIMTTLVGGWGSLIILIGGCLVLIPIALVVMSLAIAIARWPAAKETTIASWLVLITAVAGFLKWIFFLDGGDVGINSVFVSLVTGETGEIYGNKHEGLLDLSATLSGLMGSIWLLGIVATFVCWALFQDKVRKPKVD